jgi:hypothetical protein
VRPATPSPKPSVQGTPKHHPEASPAHRRSGTVALDVKQEVNDIGPTAPPPINSPSFNKREAETSVVLLNNQTLVLGGLIQNRRTKLRSGIPFLNRIPVLGYLFGSTEDKIEKTELLMLITPRVIGTAVDGRRITDQMRKATPELEQSFKLGPPPPPRTPDSPPCPARASEIAVIKSWRRIPERQRGIIGTWREARPTVRDTPPAQARASAERTRHPPRRSGTRHRHQARVEHFGSSVEHPGNRRTLRAHRRGGRSCRARRRPARRQARGRHGDHLRRLRSERPGFLRDAADGLDAGPSRQAPPAGSGLAARAATALPREILQAG